MSAAMKKLPFCLVLVFVAACSKDKTAPTTTGSDTSGSATAGSAMAGSAMAGSAMAGSAMAGSAMAGSAMAGSNTAMAGSGSAMAAGGGSGSAVAMAGSGDGWDFDKLTHEEQMDYMKKTVVPTMKPVFQKFDAKHYKDFGCKTCHGKDPKATKFKMPTPDLPKLDFVALKAGKQKPEIAKFMGEEIEPGMAKLLHRPTYNPEHPDPSQFGCLGCHEQKK